VRKRSDLDAIAFDVDGTVYSNGRMYVVSLPVVAAHPRLFHAFGRAREYVRRYPPPRDLAGETVRLTAERLRHDVPRVRAMIDSVIYDRWERALQRVPIFDGVVETLQSLRAAGYRTAALSDFPVAAKLERFGIDHLFDLAFSSEETGFLKPHVTPFAELARRLAIPRERIAYVGNSYRNDIVGAHNAGMTAIHLTRRPPHRSVADISVATWKHLPERLLTE
jgi:putative hydrolase of the HAD superfamily